MSKVAIFYAAGFEEIEGLTVVDLCRRAGVAIDTVSITDQAEVTGSHGITVRTDKVFRELDFAAYDCLLLPGGMPGTRNLEAHAGLMSQLDVFYQSGKRIGAICAAPSIFGHRGYLKGRRACCYPGFEGELDGAAVTDGPVEIDGNVVTSRGMGTAIDFGLAIVGIYAGEAKAAELGKGIVYRG